VKCIRIWGGLHEFVDGVGRARRARELLEKHYLLELDEK